MMSTANLVESPQLASHQPELLVAVSPAMRRLLAQVDIVAPHLHIATIEGGSGVGKLTLAHLIYQRYAARHPEILQSEFTRSDAREWLLSVTDPQSLTGFIFLDRVDLLADPGQALLLRILKDLDFRQSNALAILASSHSPLRDLARSGHFLTELAIRLTSVRLTVPPLRERNEDIIPLANLFLERLSARYHLPPIALTPAATTRLQQHHWPGNVRELLSVLESALIECSNNIIRAEDLPISSAPSTPHHSAPTPELLNLDAVIYRHILYVLDRNRGNKLRAARQLGISRSTLYRILERRLTFSR